MAAIAYAGAALTAKKQAGGLPERVLLVATTDKLYAYKAKPKGRDWKVEEEVAVWDRAGPARSQAGRRSGLTMLDIESPAENEKASLAPIGVPRRPGLPGVHRGRRNTVIHPQRGGRYWYYWVLIVGGTIFVIAALATDMFGTGS